MWDMDAPIAMGALSILEVRLRVVPFDKNEFFSEDPGCGCGEGGKGKRPLGGFRLGHGRRAPDPRSWAICRPGGGPGRDVNNPSRAGLAGDGDELWTGSDVRDSPFGGAPMPVPTVRYISLHFRAESY